MIEPERPDLRPRWFRQSKQDEHPAFDFDLIVGSQPFVFPRITTRILPAGSDAVLTATVLKEIIDQTQRIARYAANDVVRGVNPEFTDLRSIGADLTRFSDLTIEPFAEGSFVIPARFEAAPLERPVEGLGTVTTDAVTERFTQILKSLANRDSSNQVSLGALQSIDSLRRVLMRSSADIEYISHNSLSVQVQSFRTDSDYWERVSTTITRRRPTTQEFEQIEGRVTALDTIRGELALSIPGLERVRGHFPAALHPDLLRSLDRRVRLYGSIERKDGNPKHISIQFSEFLDEE